jgi:hypothetical protein
VSSAGDVPEVRDVGAVVVTRGLNDTFGTIGNGFPCACCFKASSGNTFVSPDVDFEDVAVVSSSTTRGDNVVRELDSSVLDDRAAGTAFFFLAGSGGTSFVVAAIVVTARAERAAFGGNAGVIVAG